MRGKEVIAGTMIGTALLVAGCSSETGQTVSSEMTTYTTPGSELPQSTSLTQLPPSSTGSINLAPPESSSATQNPAATTTTIEGPTVTVTITASPAPDNTSEPEDTLSLIKSNAPINIVLVDDKEKPVGDLEALAGKQTDQMWKSIAGNKSYEQIIKDAFEAATHNLYLPKSVTTKKAGELSIAGCIKDGDTKQTGEIEDHAKKYLEADALNVVVINQNGCENEAAGNLPVAGFASENMIPIITRGALLSMFTTEPEPELEEEAKKTNANGLADVIIHEVGHSDGLPHAGTKDCQDPAEISDCTSNPTNDPNSVMGYTFAEDAHDFTAPELWQMGLIPDGKALINPGPGTYTLSSTSDTKSSQPKLVVLHDGSNNQVYLSWEPDSQAAYDVSCVPETEQTMANPNTLYSTSRQLKDGKYVNYDCLKVHIRNQTDALQVRQQTPATGETEEFLALITRPDRAPDVLGVERSDGIVIPGTVAYEDGRQIVTFEGTDKAGDPIIKITAKLPQKPNSPH